MKKKILLSLIPIITTPISLIGLNIITSCATEPIGPSSPMCIHTQQACVFSFKLYKHPSYIKEKMHIPNIEISRDDGVTWEKIELEDHQTGEDVVRAHIDANSNIKIRGNNPEGFNQSDVMSVTIGFSGPVSITGSVMSLIDNGKGEKLTIPCDYCFANLFNNNAKLTSVDDNFLPAIKLKKGCYKWMFNSCTALTKCPKLPATDLSDAPHCYHSMFSYTPIKEPPVLPATKLSQGCYFDMFFDCTQMEYFCELPATKMEENCYAYMFSGCWAPTKLIELKATQLAKGCYQNMFHNCIGLRSIPDDFILPAKELQYDCYNSMFENCDNIERVNPNIFPSDVKLARRCLGGMFGSCDKLEYAPKLPINSELEPKCFIGMFEGCVSLYDTYEDKTPITLPWMELKEGCYSAMFTECGKNFKVAPELPATQLAEGCYSLMFQNCDYLEKIPMLPATSLAKGCYDKMFSFCTFKNLGNDFTLPAANLEEECYIGMFQGCKSLETVPNDLFKSVKQLAKNCCNSMFGACTSLTQAPDLPDAPLVQSCYTSMFATCKALIHAPALPKTQLAPFCYKWMFKDCESLVEAPELPATELVEGCYYQMFISCNKLAKLTVHFTDWKENIDATYQWFGDRPSNQEDEKIFTCPQELNTDTRDITHVPEGWTIQHFE